MRVLLLGGSGVFGSRLARLLVRDGHDVCIAGRNLSNAKALADDLGCRALQMDRSGDLSAIHDCDVVIDASGPFHLQGDDPYTVARAAIAARVHYLDLSDNAAFCAGIAALDAQAHTAGVCVISGLSSVPALSSAAVRALAGSDRPEVIDSAILPGNRSPRGLAVMQSILSQAGRPMRVWRGGAWSSETGWSDPALYRLPGGLVRQAWLIDVPDLHLFPDHFGADSVIFRAGLELAVMRYGLASFAALQRLLPIPVTLPVVRGFKLAADLLSPFGSGRGGMSVMVVAGQERRFWRLLAEDGDGPFVPAVAARALLRRSVLPVGAGPALEVITLAEAEAAMADLNLRTERFTQKLEPIFPAVLGANFALLPEPIRATHLTTDRSHWIGRASVARGTSLWSRLLGRLFGFPPDCDDTVVQVTKTVTPQGEIWQRRFGTSVFRSRLKATSQGMTESFGPFTFRLGLKVDGGALHFPVVGGCLGPLPLPKVLLPISESREECMDGAFHFDVRLYAPVTQGLLVHYRGTLKAAPYSS